MKTKITIAIVGALIAFGSYAVADDRAKGRQHGFAGPGGARMLHAAANPERMVERMTRKLDLDESQQQELMNVLLAAQPEMEALRDRARANRSAINELDASAAGYDAAIQNLATESGQVATDMTLLVSRLRADVHSKLTPEQQQTLAEARPHGRRGKPGRRQESPEDSET